MSWSGGADAAVIVGTESVVPSSDEDNDGIAPTSDIFAAEDKGPSL
jgi:hypothetical protein